MEYLVLAIFVGIALASIKSAATNVYVRESIKDLWDTWNGYKVVATGKAEDMGHAATAVRFRLQTGDYGSAACKTQIVGTEKNGYIWVIKIKPKKEIDDGA